MNYRLGELAILIALATASVSVADDFFTVASQFARFDEAPASAVNETNASVTSPEATLQSIRVFEPLDSLKLFHTRQLAAPIESVLAATSTLPAQYRRETHVASETTEEMAAPLLGPELNTLPEPNSSDSFPTAESGETPAMITEIPVGEPLIQSAAPVAQPWITMRNPTTRVQRLGWWWVNSSGNPVKVGEYQSLKSSVFGDVDGLLSNGLNTLDYSHSMLDNDASQSYARFYGPMLRGEIEYDRYLRRLDRDPLDFYVDFDQQPPRPLPGPPANFRDMKEDLSVGEDFAIRVQELDTSFQGKVTENVKWRLNLWGMRKHGERQAIAMAHCFEATNATDTNGNPAPGRSCHMLSQTQRIDWLTAEIEPALEYNRGPLNVEYSRTMRMLSTNDQLVTRPYDRFGLNGDQPYAVVPENTTAIDRIKLGLQLPGDRDAYARLYTGNTENEFRDTNRRFHGYDIRLTDRSIDRLTLTGYAKNYIQTGQFPTFFLPTETVANVNVPINYDRTTVGLSSSWRPFGDLGSLGSRLVLSSGYEYRDIQRENAIFVEEVLTSNQAATKTNQLQMRATMNWSEQFSSYSRYRLTFIDDPLYAVPIRNTTTNTNLPNQTHHIEFGSTWSPTYTFMLTGLFGVNTGWNSSDVARFEEDNNDIVLTAWYNPLPRWSLSGGMAFYSNWIDQDITLGSKLNPVTLPWEYGGRSDVLNFGTSFAWTERLTLNGTLDFVRGRNAFDPLVPWPELNSLSDVNVETTRLSVGTDYFFGPRTGCYARYQIFDYDDRAGTTDGGTAEMVLVGASAYY